MTKGVVKMMMWARIKVAMIVGMLALGAAGVPVAVHVVRARRQAN